MRASIKYLIVFFGLMIIAPLTSHAACSYERQAELSRIAANVQFSYSYEINNSNMPTFKIDITNVTNDIYVKDVYDNVFMKDSSYEYNYGQSVRFYIHSNDVSCRNEEIAQRYVSLPMFNNYSKSLECLQNPEFKYCQIWLDTSNITFETFQNEMKNYVETLNEKNDVEENDTPGIWDTISTIITENKTILMFVLSAIIILGIIIFVKKRWMK